MHFQSRILSNLRIWVIFIIHHFLMRCLKIIIFRLDITMDAMVQAQIVSSFVCSSTKFY